MAKNDADDEQRIPDILRFKWKYCIADKESCDTFHMLYSLQSAIESVKTKFNLNSTRIISNFLEWHLLNKQENKFDGKLFEKSTESNIIDIISEIGDVPKEAATEIYPTLKTDTMVDYYTWHGLYHRELSVYYDTRVQYAKYLEECTTEEIVTLLTFVNNDPNAWKYGTTHDPKYEDILRGVFQKIKCCSCFRIDRDNKRLKPRPSNIQKDIMINGKDGAITKEECCRVVEDDASQDFIDSFDEKAKAVQRWEKLVVDFVRGIPRTYEFDGGKYDIAAGYGGDINTERSQRIEKGTSPLELSKDGKLEAISYGEWDGDRFRNDELTIIEKWQVMMDYLISPKIKNTKGRRFNCKLRDVKSIFSGLIQINILECLKAADAQKKAFHAFINLYCNQMPIELRQMIFQYQSYGWSNEDISMTDSYELVD